MIRYGLRANSENSKAFTLVELLVVISVISILISILLPALGRVRQQAKSIQCLANLRQLGVAFYLYGNDYEGRALPTWMKGEFWWGKPTSDHIDHEAGFLWPYLRTALKKNSLYECPSQPYGTYRLQGKPTGAADGPQWITSTYGYNGYYLCPAASRWAGIAHRPWQKLSTIKGPENVMVFADTLLSWANAAQARLTNTALLDPPQLFYAGTWQDNTSPTTCFRHFDRANAAFADGHVGPLRPAEGQYSNPTAKIGSVSSVNGPYYVPDYQDWVKDSD